MRIVWDIIERLSNALSVILALIQLGQMISKTGRNKKDDQSSRSDRSDS